MQYVRHGNTNKLLTGYYYFIIWTITTLKTYGINRTYDDLY